MSIITEAPTWLISVCLLVGLIYAGALYFRDRFNRTYGSFLASVLGILRFAVVSLLCFFILKPFVKSIEKKVEKPIVVIAQDNSHSLVVGKDSTYYKNEYLNQLKALTSAFGEDYDIFTYSFGNQVKEGIDSISYNEKLTDFSGLLDDLYNRYSGRNLGAIVIASDGLYNKGSNPVYSYQKLNVPVFTIALGDTTVQRDVLINSVTANRLAYKGNKFPMEIVVEGRKAQGESCTLTVSRKGSVIHSEPIIFDKERFFKTINLSFDATDIGLQKYSISITGINDEITRVNNSKDVFIDVLDGRQKVLILGYAPHPDLGALREAIASNESYKVEMKLAKDFSGNVSDYSLVILHQLPAAGGAGTDIIQKAMNQNIPCLFEWGNSTDFNSFNSLNLGYSLSNYRNNITDVSAGYNESFSLFTLEPNVTAIIPNLSPLAVPFGDFSTSPGVSPLFFQQVGLIKTQKPLVSFNKVQDNKIGLICGEGIWRWRIGAFQQTESHDAFNEIITKCVQYLSSKEDKSLFRVNGKNDFLENEPVLFEAELYNPSFEPINNRDVNMKIRNEEGQEFDYTFSPSGVGYKLNAGQLPVGNYSYVASVNSDQGMLKETGEFSVSPLQLEFVNTIADHRLLYQFAHDNNGEMVYPSNMNSIADMIRNKKEIVSVAYENKKLDDLINYKWILALLIAMLGLEWLLRKRSGTY